MTNEEFDNWMLNQLWELHTDELGLKSIRTTKARNHGSLGWIHDTIIDGGEFMEHIVDLHNQWYNTTRP